MNVTFGSRLFTALQVRGPLCVGIDPHPALLSAWGLPDSPAGLETFGRTVVEAVGELVPALKPQSAFFERHGSAGIAALERILVDARASGALTIIDVKRGDIGSTAVGYAEAYLNPDSPLGCDAMTANPYLGIDTLAPLFTTAIRYRTGVFVLALTSNPDAALIQYAQTSRGETVAQTVLHELAVRNNGVTPLGSFGAVVGITVGETNHNLSTVNGPILAPGLGAQGGTAADLQSVFRGALPAVLPAVSRSVLAVGPSVAELRRATIAEKEACLAALGAT